MSILTDNLFTLAEFILFAERVASKVVDTHAVYLELAARDPRLFLEITETANNYTNSLWVQDAQTSINNQRMVEAIKTIRANTQLGLKDSKRVADVFKDTGIWNTHPDTSVPYHTASAELINTRSDLFDAQNEVMRMKNDIADLRNELQRANADRDDAENAHANVQARLDTLTNENRDLARSHTTLLSASQTIAEAANKTIAKLEDELNLPF